jgi:peroxiredoxin
VLAVDVGETETQVRGFVEKRPFPYPVLLDPESELADSLGVYSLPTLMVIDTRGEVTYFEPGLLAENDLCQVLADAGTTRTC